MTQVTGADVEKQAFKAFAERHEAVNRWFRSTELSYRLARMVADQHDPSSLVRTLFRKGWRREDTLKQYRGRFSAEGRAPRASVSDFLQDLYEGWQSLLEAVIVQEAGALEYFLREWVLAAIQEALASSKSLQAARVGELQKMASDIRSEPYSTLSLGRVSTLFPTLKGALEATTHVRSTRPLLSAAVGDLSCKGVADLWREVRNLILHHDRIVHQRFASDFGTIWYEMQKEARERGSKIAPHACTVGEPLPIVARHAVFCLTSCYQAAVVLHVSVSGET